MSARMPPMSRMLVLAKKGTRERGQAPGSAFSECSSLSFVNGERSSLSKMGATVTMKKREKLHSKVKTQEFFVY